MGSLAPRCLSVRRPWANLILGGHKTIENRSWSTRHRGPMVIHAGQRWEPAGATLAALLGFTGYETPGSCPAGYLGVVELVDVHPAAGDCCWPWGQPGPDIHHWVLGAVQAFDEPVPGPGRLGLYSLPGAVSALL